MYYLVRLVLLAAWMIGIVIAKGFWSTFFAVIFPFWAYYLVAERMVEMYLR